MAQIDRPPTPDTFAFPPGFTPSVQSPPPDLAPYYGFARPPQPPSISTYQPTLGTQLTEQLYRTLTGNFPGAEALGAVGGVLKAQPLRGQSVRIANEPINMDPKRFMTVKDPSQRAAFTQPKGYEEEQYKTALKLRITLPDGEVFEDGIKGMNVGHALRRAADNWTNAKSIQVIGQE